MAKVDLLVKNGSVWTPGGFVEADIAVTERPAARELDVLRKLDPARLYIA